MALLLQLAVGALLTRAALAQDSLIVSTDCGAVQGAWDASPLGTTVAAWRSIPFAAPPVGDLRWRVAQPPTCWSPSTYDATYFRDVCSQGDGLLGSEDCLYLTVYVPEAVRNGSVAGPAPVWVYIHGGSLTSGSPNWEPLQVFAARTNTIVVAVAYRLGPIGWLATAELSAVQPSEHNFGLTDQQAALQWVQRNIASFGGNPSRVTLGGQSSGGTSIFALLSSPASAGLFHAAISLSGSPNISVSLQAAHAQNQAVVPALGCAGSNATAVVACLRSKSAADLWAVVPNSWNTPGLFGLEGLSPAGRDFGGLPVVDGRIISLPFPDALAAGLVDVPLLLSSMAQEADLGPDEDVSGMNATAWAAQLASDFASWPGSAPLVQDLLTAYAVEAAEDADKAYTTINADYGIRCANAQLAVAAMAAGKRKSGIFVAVNAWNPQNPQPSVGRDVRWAYHMWDYNAALENWAIGSAQPQADDDALSALLQQQWGTFVATAGGGLERWGWRSVEAVPGFPSTYGAYVYERQPYGGTAFVEGYGADRCAMLAKWGFDARFWWCD